MEYNWSDKSALIVDDTYVNIYLLKAILEHTNIKITTASNSSDFFKVIKKRYDIVLMDINLGERLTGVDLIRHMDSKNINTPVIIITAYGSNFFDNTVRHDFLIPKPFNAEDLLFKMNQIFTNN